MVRKGKSHGLAFEDRLTYYKTVAGWSRVGMAVELFGFLNLFGSFFPLVFSFLRTLPVIGPFLNLPGVSTVVDKISGKASSSMV